MKTHIASVLVRLSSPLAGHEVRRVVRELVRVAGVRRIPSNLKIPRLLSIDYDPNIVQVSVLLSLVRRGWTLAQLV